MLFRLVPTIFFGHLNEGLDLFVEGLAFDLLHREAAMAVVGRDGTKAIIKADATLAGLDRPELAIETDAIAALRQDIGTRRPDLLHPNLPDVTERPWGAREFAVLDRTGVCVVFRQWP